MMDDIERSTAYRQTFNTETGRRVLADIAARTGVQGYQIPPTDNALHLAYREGRRSMTLEIMSLAGVELQFEFPPLDREAKRPQEIETEKAA